MALPEVLTAAHLLAASPAGGDLLGQVGKGHVRVPDSLRIGAVDGGWGVMRVALVHERGTATALGDPCRRLIPIVESSVVVGRARRSPGGPPR